ncbi:MAG TPA: FAD binding domain-containing protein [Nordella sp.]|nr:FAD binding domain-containing protein [Nordella sp.]
MSVTLSAAKQARLVPALQAEGGRIVAGGTLLVADLNAGPTAGGALITLDRLGLDRIAVTGGKVTLGAMVTMAALARDRRLRFLHPVANSIGGPAVRAMATVGGNLFAPAPYGDMAAALLALDAEVTLHDGKATRKLPIDAFLTQRARLRKSCVVSVSFASPAAGAFRYLKAVRRKPVSASVVTIAALLPRKAGKIKGARIALGAMAANAIRARKAEAALEGQALGAGVIAAAAQLITEGSAPEDDAYATAWYRREIAPVHFTRLLSARGE